MTGKEIRLKRLFSRGDNAVVIAMDHGEFDGPIEGMEDIPATAAKIDQCVDAVLMSPGSLPRCSFLFEKRGGPLAMVRLNWSTTYCFHWKYDQAATCRVMSPADAAAAGADIVLVSLTLQTGDEERDAANVEVFAELCAEAHLLGLPVVGEYFPAGEPSNEALADGVLRGSRIIAELGADAVKTFHTAHFKAVAGGCPAPILALGGVKLPTQLDALELARREIDEGARGVVFGRNAIQVVDPARFQHALCDVVRDGMGAKEAAEKHSLEG